jgi:hypothetical protein
VRTCLFPRTFPYPSILYHFCPVADSPVAPQSQCGLSYFPPHHSLPPPFSISEDPSTRRAVSVSSKSLCNPPYRSFSPRIEPFLPTANAHGPPRPLSVSLPPSSPPSLPPSEARKDPSHLPHPGGHVETQQVGEGGGQGSRGRPSASLRPVLGFLGGGGGAAGGREGGGGQSHHPRFLRCFRSRRRCRQGSIDEHP